MPSAPLHQGFCDPCYQGFGQKRPGHSSDLPGQLQRRCQSNVAIVPQKDTQGRGAIIGWSGDGEVSAKVSETELAAPAKTMSLLITATDQERVIESTCNYTNVCDEKPVFFEE